MQTSILISDLAGAHRLPCTGGATSSGIASAGGAAFRSHLRAVGTAEINGLGIPEVDLVADFLQDAPGILRVALLTLQNPVLVVHPGLLNRMLQRESKVNQIGDQLKNHRPDPGASAASQNGLDSIVLEHDHRGHHGGDGMPGGRGVEPFRVQVRFAHDVVGDETCARNDESCRFTGRMGQTDRHAVFVYDTQVSRAGRAPGLWYPWARNLFGKVLQSGLALQTRDTAEEVVNDRLTTPRVIDLGHSTAAQMNEPDLSNA